MVPYNQPIMEHVSVFTNRLQHLRSDNDIQLVLNWSAMTCDHRTYHDLSRNVSPECGIQDPRMWCPEIEHHVWFQI